MTVTTRHVVHPGWGYGVWVYRGDVVINHYTAGDSQHDSQVYGTNEVNAATLEKYARSTTTDLKNETEEAMTP